MDIEQHNWCIKAQQQKDCTLCNLAPVVLFVAVDFVGHYYGLVLNSVWITMQMFLAFVYYKSTNKDISKLMLGLLFILLFRTVYLKHLGY